MNLPDAKNGIIDIQSTAQMIMNQRPGAVVRYWLLRDVFKNPGDDPELVRAKPALDDSRCVQEVMREQKADGSWGAFHSRSSVAKQKIVTTEVGVTRAIALGLDAAHPVLQQALRYLLDVLQGRHVIPDRGEKNDRWFWSLETLARLFSTWARYTQPAIEAIWQRRGAYGLWDIGPRASSSIPLPLSDSWRSLIHQKIDWSVRVLDLLRKYFDGLHTLE